MDMAAIRGTRQGIAGNETRAQGARVGKEHCVKRCLIYAYAENPLFMLSLSEAVSYMWGVRENAACVAGLRGLARLLSEDRVAERSIG